MHSWFQQGLPELQTAVAQQNPDVLSAGNLTAGLDAVGQHLGALPAAASIGAVNQIVDEAGRRLEQIQAAQLQAEEALRLARDTQHQLMDEARAAKQAGLVRLQEQEKAADKLLAALGAAGTSSGYKGTAAEERSQADFWRWVALAAGVITAAIGLYLVSQVSPDATLEDQLRRALALVPSTLIAAYAGKQSAGHRREQREARRLELSFGSIDAYLADLDAEPRAELKKQVSLALYSHGSPGYEDSDYPSSKDLVGLLQEAIRRIK